MEPTNHENNEPWPPEPSPANQASEVDPNVYPGKLAHWFRLRDAAENTNDPTLKAVYELAAQVAGLSVIADGIRFNTGPYAGSARKKSEQQAA